MAKGDLLSLSCAHPTLGSRVFEIKSQSDFSWQRGGYKINDDDGNITSSGKFFAQMNAYPWSAEATVVSNSGDVEYLQDIANTGVPATWTFTHISEGIYVGSGFCVGDISDNLQSGEMSLTFKGSKILERLA